MMKSTTKALAVCAAALLAVPAMTMAGTTVSDGKSAKDAKTIEKVKESCISGDIGINAYSQYIFHGITLENQGAILQPYADLYFKLYEGDGFVNKVSLDLGIWNSLHSNHTVASSTRWWYEFDFLAGISVTFAKNFTFSGKYVMYASPGDYFQTAHVVQAKLSYDTSDALGFSLSPYVMVEAELENKAGNGADEGFYYEVGVAPSFQAGPVTITVPLVAGFGSNEYYAQDAGYGFFSAGVNFGYQLGFIPECYGTWTLNANATYFHYGEHNELPNAVKDGEDYAFVFGGGLMVAF